MCYTTTSLLLMPLGLLSAEASLQAMRWCCVKMFTLVLQLLHGSTKCYAQNVLCILMNDFDGIFDTDFKKPSLFFAI